MTDISYQTEHGPLSGELILNGNLHGKITTAAPKYTQGKLELTSRPASIC